MLIKMLEFPEINPIAIDLGIIKIRWYAISYIVGILFSWFLILKIIKSKSLNINDKCISELISNCMIGIIVGGRLGYVLFYNPEYFYNNLIDVFKIWNGGMSFHGGFIGVVLAVIFTCKSYNIPTLLLSDLIAVVSPIGLFFGRLANFINGELYGRITTHKFGMIFPNGGNLPRHPSQLYEAFFEGIILFLMLSYFTKLGYLKKPGLISSMFLIFYSFFRFVIEFFRNPDPQIGYIALNLTLGQFISIIFLILGDFSL